jgi:hypothetical protein
MQENLKNAQQNLVMLKNIFETETDIFLGYAIEYLQDNLENMILYLSDPDKMEEMKRNFAIEQQSGKKFNIS